MHSKSGPQCAESKSRHSEVQALQLQRPETKDHSRGPQDTAADLPIRPGCSLQNHCGPMITGSGRRFSSQEIESSSPNSRSRSRRSEAGFTVVYPMWSPVILLSAIVLTCLLRSISCIIERRYSVRWLACSSPCFAYRKFTSITSDFQMAMPRESCCERSDVQERSCR